MARLLRMPAVAANAVEAVLAEWPLAEKSAFSAGGSIATVETEKAVVDIPAEADGVLLKTLVAPGTTVQVGDPIALLADPGETVTDVDSVLAELGATPDGATSDGARSEAVAGSAAPEAPSAPAEQAAPAAANGGGRIFASPLARRMAREAGLTLAELNGTGPGGRIVRRDVEQAIAARPRPEAPVEAVAAASPQPAAVPYVDTPHSRMRRAIATRLTESARDTPHFSVRGTARVDKLLRLRARLNESAPTRISVNDLVVLAVARAHVLVPAMNVIWTEEAIRSFPGVDVGIAVASERGLVTPVLRGVDRLTVSAVAAATADLVARARSNRLRQDELEGGAITVSNLGGYGTEEFTAIINPPQSAILAVGAAREEPVVRKGRLAAGTVMRVTLSVDHRPIDGAVAAQWMAAFLALLEEPLRILA